MMVVRVFQIVLKVADFCCSSVYLYFFLSFAYVLDLVSMLQFFKVDLLEAQFNPNIHKGLY